MGRLRRKCGSKYSDDFKKRLVSESLAAGVIVPMVSRHHGVPTSLIFSWRGDPRFQPEAVEVPAFVPVEATDTDEPRPFADQRPVVARIEITLENGRRLSVSDGADADFVLELARGLAA